MASEEDDTTAMSDLNSLQNFSYYGRRFQDRNTRMQESPVASDAVSMNYNLGHKQVAAGFNAQHNPVSMNKTANLKGNTSAADTMSDNVSSFTGFYRGGG